MECDSGEKYSLLSPEGAKHPYKAGNIVDVLIIKREDVPNISIVKYPIRTSDQVIPRRPGVSGSINFSVSIRHKLYWGANIIRCVALYLPLKMNEQYRKIVTLS
jgi:hypothetical protein